MSPARKTLFRFAAVCLGLSVFLVFECVCRLAGWGAQSVAGDAFSEFASIRPLFVQDANGAKYEVAANRREFFAAESFAVEKPSDERRIFVFGGSTVQGRPFSIPTAFTTFLEIALETADATTRWKVVNCGGISYASYRLLPIMRECVSYEPDLFIVCTGHNEFLECVTYADVRNSSAATITGHHLLTRLHSFRLVKNTLLPAPPTKPPTSLLPEEVDAILDHRGGLDAYNRTALSRNSVVNGFRRNLQQMNTLAREASVPLVLISPPCNIADCPPFKSEFSEEVTATTQNQIYDLLSQAAEQTTTAPAESLQKLQQAGLLDPQFAFTWYQLGRTLQSQGRTAAAREALNRARDEDVCPLRMTSALYQVLTDVAEQNSIPLLDVDRLLAGRSRDGLTGHSILVDHVHPSFFGHQLIAVELLKFLADRGYVGDMTDQEEAAAQQRFEKHLTSLEDLYFLRGRRTLESLRAWTEGRADGPPLKTAQ